jgi:ribonuclease R
MTGWLKLIFTLTKKHINGAKNGQKVKVKFISWPKNLKSPQAAVTEIIGNPGEINVEMNSILAEYGFPLNFPKNVEDELNFIDSPNYNLEADKRLDFRTKTTFTIDPNDAKDFDDALSIVKLDNGVTEVGIHIADVGHFVEENSALDNEAYSRSNSVYLVDRVIPMLPEKLSNELCSLRPNEDKLTFSAVFQINEKAEIISTWFGKTIIHSDQRFTYDQAQEIIEGKDHDLSKEINLLNDIARLLRANRLTKGALNVESTEVRFEIDDKGEPIGTFLKISKEAHQLIEEFMLLANKHVAIKMGKPAKDKFLNPFIYRIHDDPNEEKLNDLKLYLDSMGYKIIREKNKPVSYSLNKVMKKAKENKELHLIAPMVIRSMSKAIYSSENIGHYGLAFEYYTHFTSPIRRYADLIVHRKLINSIEQKNTHLSNAKDLEYTCSHLSKMEKQATDAERASIKYMQVKFLSKKIGEKFTGLISGITDWGIYIELDENKCEGMVTLSSMKDDQYFYDKELQMMVGYHNQKTYKMGQEVEIIVKKTDLYKRQIDFKLIS